MKRYTKLRPFLVLFALVLLLAACGSGDAEPPAGSADSGSATVGSLTIEGAWARPPAMAGGNGAAYFTVRNDGDTADRLIAVASPLAMAEMHESVMADDGTMAMNPVEGVDVPPNGSVEFKRGGLHVMFMGIAEPPAVGDTVSLTLTFQNAGDVTVNLPVREE